MWDRHVLNCGVVADAFPPGVRVIDVGSGAGLPGVPLALARPDLRITLLDSLGRRVKFLTEAVDELGLAAQVRVMLGRAEEHRDRYDVVTARAVASLDKLGRWTAGLVETGGHLVSLRGDRAGEELRNARSALGAAGWHSPAVVTYTEGHSVSATVVTAKKR